MDKLRGEREVVLSKRPPFPKNMIVELTNICNHSCIFCAHRKMTRKQGICNRNVMLNIIKQAFMNGTREIGFYLTGEPFLCADLEFYVKECKKLGFTYIYLTTNGVYADAKKVKQLAELGLSSIKFSINAATKETYFKIHGKDDFDIVIHNLKQIHSIKEKGELLIPVFASFVTIKLNERELELYKEKMAIYCDEFHFSFE